MGGDRPCRLRPLRLIHGARISAGPEKRPSLERLPWQGTSWLHHRTSGVEISLPAVAGQDAAPMPCGEETKPVLLLDAGLLCGTATILSVI